MNTPRKHLCASPAQARVLPFVLFVAPLFVQDWLGDAARHWVYLGRTLIGAWCIWEMRSLVPEMRWKISWEAVVAGVLALVIWVGLDPFYPSNHLLFKASSPWNPFNDFGKGSAFAWFFFSVRTLGSSLVVPPLEEVFWRSFLYRYFISADFEKVALNRLHWGSIIVTSLLFGLEHYQWLAGILVGLLFQFLVLRKGRLGDAIVAHAITNFLLSLWVYWRGDWAFW